MKGIHTVDLKQAPQGAASSAVTLRTLVLTSSKSARTALDVYLYVCVCLLCVCEAG